MYKNVRWMNALYTMDGWLSEIKHLPKIRQILSEKRQLLGVPKYEYRRFFCEYNKNFYEYRNLGTPKNESIILFNVLVGVAGA